MEIARDERRTPWKTVRIFSGKLEEPKKESCESERELGLETLKARPVAVPVPVMRYRAVFAFAGNLKVLLLIFGSLELSLFSSAE